MTRKTLSQRLALGEDQETEFKSTAESHATIGAAVCGFLNTRGGYVLCGIGDGGDILGIDEPDTAAARLERVLAERLSPAALIYVRPESVAGKKILVVEVPAGQDVPYAFRDVIYIREGDATRKADVATIRDIVLRRQVEPERWERRFSLADPERDLDLQELRLAAGAIQTGRPGYFGNADDAVSVLETLSVARYGRLTNAGDVLFCLNPAKRFPQVRVRAACYTRDRNDPTYADFKSFEGPIVPVLEAVHGFIRRNTPTRAHFSHGCLTRRDVPQYPDEAIREGLVNAFAHRDYADASGGLTVSIFPDRLEIWNSGALPDGVTPDTLSRGGLSVLRNPDLAHVLYLRGLMEKLGRGSLLMTRLCKERGLPEPRWTTEGRRGVTLTFFAGDVTTDVAGDVTTDVAGDVTTEVRDEVRRLLGVLHGDMSRKALQQALGLQNDEHVRKAYLRPALEAGLIEMTLPTKPQSTRQRYRLTARGRAVKHGAER